MTAEEFFTAVGEAVKQIGFLKTLLSASSGNPYVLTTHDADRVCASTHSWTQIEEVDSMLRDNLVVRYKEASVYIEIADTLLFQMPDPRWAHAIRRKYLFGWKKRRIAHELNTCDRTVSNMIDAGMRWVDEEADLDELMKRAGAQARI